MTASEYLARECPTCGETDPTRFNGRSELCLGCQTGKLPATGFIPETTGGPP